MQKKIKFKDIENIEERVEEDIIRVLEDIIVKSIKDPDSGCPVTIMTNEKIYSSLDKSHLHEYQETVNYVLRKIIAYKKQYGSEATKQELDKAPYLNKEIKEAGKDKELQVILKVA